MKRRIYEIARERGIPTQELADKLRAAGVEVKSNLSSVEESDAERVLSPAPKSVPAEKAVPKEEGKTPGASRTSKPAKTAKEQGTPAESAEAPKKATSVAGKRAGAPASAPANPGAATATRSETGVPAGRPAGRPFGGPAGSGAPRKGRPKPPRPRLEDLPTVVGKDVPVRKGVKPSGKVHIKGEEPKPAPKPEAPAAGAAPARGARPEGAGSRPGPGAGAGRAPDRGPSRFGRPAAAPATTEGGSDTASRPGVAGRRRPVEAGRRVRRGDEKGTRRRVVIDSQAGRKTGGAGSRERKGQVAEPAALAKRKAPPGTESPVTVNSGATVKDLADALEIGAGEIIKTLMKLGEMVTITQSLSDEAVLIVAEEFGRQVEVKHVEEESAEPVFVDAPEDLRERAPVVTIMGHVDHGKTSLLDAIRETEVVKSEAGGITQHIGAYQVHHKDRPVTFIDTPGHEAFTAMRARGAKVTDIAVIVVAANDGVMPQTVEAISHARAAEVPILVAVNKIDLPDANPDKVRQQLTEYALVPEEWGGDTIFVDVSAKKRINLDELMDMLLLVSAMQELKANPSAPASGVVIEAQLDVGRGPVATLLVQRGTLRVGDPIVSGEAHGKVKAMFDFKGEPVEEAGPAMPVQILGFNTVPVAGDFAMVAKDDREARQRAESRTARLRAEQLLKERVGTTSLDDFYRRLKEGAVKELALVVKADVGGSVEALEEALNNVTHPEAKVRVIHSGVGGINESDIMLAAASGAVVIGFNVRPSVAAKALAEQDGVDVRTYRVIYKAIEDVQAALMGMLEPETVEEELGTAEVRQVFRSSKVGNIAGAYVLAGKITRSAKVRVVRDGSIVHEGSIGTLRRFTDDVKEVLAGFECGIHLEGFDDIHEGDVIEAYEMKEVARTQ